MRSDFHQVDGNPDVSRTNSLGIFCGYNLSGVVELFNADVKESAGV